MVVPSPAAVPAAQPGLSAGVHQADTSHLALDLVGAAPGGAAAAVTTAVTAVLRSCPDGTVRTPTRGVRAWFVTPGQ